MNIFGKTLLILLFLTAVLASCNSGQSTPTTSDAEIVETVISTVSTVFAETQRAMPTATANVPTESVPAALLTLTARPIATDSPTNTSLPGRTPTPTRTSPPPSPTPIGSSGKIAFVSCEYIWVTQDTALVEETDYDSCEIYLMNPDGSGQTNLTNNNVWDGDPAPSPDGKKIAYVSGSGRNPEIYVMNADGSNKTQLTNNKYRDAEPAWSPDGTQLVFSTLHAFELSEIRIMNLDGSGQTVLAESSVSAEGYHLSPAWSPLGTQIAYIRESFNSDCQGCSEIFVMNVDGSNSFQLTRNNATSHDPTWSPDGTKIIYAANSGIIAINLDGSGQTKLTSTKSQDTNPTFSPDGRAIAFQSDRGQSVVGDFDIYIVSEDGSSLQRLTDDRNSSSPAWLPIPRNPSIQHPDCTSGWSRLKAGNQARVSQETNTPNRVRQGPTTADAIIGLLEPRTDMNVIEGPVCADGLIFWRVEHQSIPGGTGWTAEGDGTEYWLEPYVP